MEALVYYYDYIVCLFFSTGCSHGWKETVAHSPPEHIPKGCVLCPGRERPVAMTTRRSYRRRVVEACDPLVALLFCFGNPSPSSALKTATYIGLNSLE